MFASVSTQSISVIFQQKTVGAIYVIVQRLKSSVNVGDKKTINSWAFIVEGRENKTAGSIWWTKQTFDASQLIQQCSNK